LAVGVSPDFILQRLRRASVRARVPKTGEQMKEVLVVDDSSVIRKVARRILEGLHMRTSEAADARSALVACEKRMPDGILLDWNMPEMGGVEFLIALRQMPGGAAPKVVFCTSEK
jgi:two-component system chemotaxis response regulator CheY